VSSTVDAFSTGCFFSRPTSLAPPTFFIFPRADLPECDAGTIIVMIASVAKHAKTGFSFVTTLSYVTVNRHRLHNVPWAMGNINGPNANHCTQSTRCLEELAVHSYLIDPPGVNSVEEWVRYGQR